MIPTLQLMAADLPRAMRRSATSTHAWRVSSTTPCSLLAGAKAHGTEPYGATTFPDYAYATFADCTLGPCTTGDVCVLSRNRGSYPGSGTLQAISASATSVPGVGKISFQRFDSH